MPLMQRDSHTVVLLLRLLREAETSYVGTTALSEGLADIAGDDDVPEGWTQHHLEIMSDIGLVKPKHPGPVTSSTEWRLAWEGYNAVEDSGDDDEDDDTLDD